MREDVKRREIDAALNNIRWYAEENGLDADQIKAFFDAGIVKFRIGEVRHVYNRKEKEPAK